MSVSNSWANFASLNILLKIETTEENWDSLSLGVLEE